VDLTGHERRQFGTPRSFGPYPSLSPDGRTLAISIRSPNNDDIYLMDVATGRFDRFSFAVSEDESPVWSPDGHRVAFTSAAVGEQRRIFVKTIGSTEPERLVYTGKRHLHLSSWSPDGDWLAVDEFAPRSVDAWLLNVKDTSKIIPVATTPADERGASFSPDGRSIAYSSDETGRYEVYMLSFPTMGGRQQVSHDGGFLPKWSGDGQRLFFFDAYTNASGNMMTARRAAAGLTWEEPKALFNVPRIYDFDVRRDASTIYFIASNPDGVTHEIRVITNWLREILNP
jgi:eukaryotic-like serine/threonine-protein kinase